MTIRYVGSGGNDANNGLSWATRKLTLNGVEDTPVEAGDIVYVAPGVYRELLTCDVSGVSGSSIAYIGDVTGEHTDGVGGIVRITGSDNDTTSARTTGITATSKNYRSFSGFAFDSASSYCIFLNGCIGVLITNSFFFVPINGRAVLCQGAAQSNVIVSNNYIIASAYAVGIYFFHDSALDNVNHQCGNNIIFGFGTSSVGIVTARVGGIVVNNNTIAANIAVQVANALTVGQTVTATNNIVLFCSEGFRATASGEITEDYNAIYSCATSRTNTNTGAHSNAYPPLFNQPILLDGFRFPWFFGELSKWSQLARIAGTGEATDDLFGITRPATSAKKSWGAIQATGAARETTTTYDSSVASLKLPDAGEQFLMRVPITAVSTIFTVQVYREADYAGDNPQLIVRQAGQSDNTATDTGSAGTWNELSVTLTPAASPGWVDIFVVSRNTATSGDYDVFFDNLVVS